MTSTPGLELLLGLLIMLQCQVLRGGRWGSVLVGGPNGTGVQADAGMHVTLLRNCCISWQPEHIPRCCPVQCNYPNLNEANWWPVWKTLACEKHVF
eukprot:1143046-Pelagomonas_calceolata.AAC.8